MAIVTFRASGNASDTAVELIPWARDSEGKALAALATSLCGSSRHIFSHIFLSPLCAWGFSALPRFIPRRNKNLTSGRRLGRRTLPALLLDSPPYWR